MFIGSAYAETKYDTSFIENFLELDEGAELDFSAKFKLNSLYPYDDSQTAVYSRALNNFKLNCAVKNELDRQYFLSNLIFVDSDIFTNVELEYNDNRYILNTLLNDTILKTSGQKDMFDIYNIENPFKETQYFNSEKALFELENIINTLDKGEKRRRVSFEVKGFKDPYEQSNTDIDKNNIDEYSNTIFALATIGLDEEYIQSLGLELKSRYSYRVLFDKEDRAIGVRIKGAVLLNGKNQELSSTIDFTPELNKVKIDNKFKESNTKYIYTKLDFAKSEGINEAFYEKKDRDNVIIQEEARNFIIDIGKSQNTLKGKYKRSNHIENGKTSSSKSLEISSDITLEKSDRKRYIRGNAGIKYFDDEILMLDAEAEFANSGNMQKCYDIASIFDVAIRNGGIEQNIDYFNANEDKAEIINIDEYSDDVQKALQEDLKKQFSAKTLRAMLTQEDNSAYILSYGMQPEDWQEFLDYYKSLEE